MGRTARATVEGRVSVEARRTEAALCCTPLWLPHTSATPQPLRCRKRPEAGNRLEAQGVPFMTGRRPETVP